MMNAGKNLGLRLRNARSYFNHTHHKSFVPLPLKYKIGLGVSALVSYTYWPMVCLSNQDRTDFTVLDDPDRFVKVDSTWIDYWLKLRDTNRLERKFQQALVTSTPDAAAEKLLNLARQAEYNKLIEDLKLLEPVLDSASRAQLKQKPNWA
eukprot:NODE_9691_length_630_cov_113.386588_g9424_i0.p1 GENE.NODE_9691_length_630_cov_113.386588_g9424_i0~~NODE_9691_length_630_cov_113.386588_g9424_i0.p1  ORF type:complete len:167 (+),score=57.43 NODE_9691_length_630_cov_113.386588_g9424_i0:54-503(+)